jgi:TatD DNase family protein
VIDTHTHLDALEDPAAALMRARAQGVDRIISIGTGPDSWAAVLELSEEYDGVYAVLGLHPHEARPGADVGPLPQLLSRSKVVGLGEIGLDYYRDYAPRDAQSKLFIYQLNLAKQAKLPVVIHNRSADEDTLSILRQWFDGTVILHCFSSIGLLDEALERGYYVSFAGNVTYPKAAELREAAKRIPRERILAETAAPYLAPQPVRGMSNEPAFVVHTVAALAQARGEDPGELARQIDANATAAFGLS